VPGSVGVARRADMPARITKRSGNAEFFSVDPNKGVKLPSYNNYSCVLPAMAAATSISAAAYKGDVNLIDVSSEAKEQYKVVSVPHLLPRAKALYSHRSHAAAGSLVDDYLRALLPHVEVRDTPGRRLGVDDIIPFSAGTNRGAYFNFMHWDSDWTMARRRRRCTTVATTRGSAQSAARAVMRPELAAALSCSRPCAPTLAAQFPDAAGFQMWCLTTAPQPQARGEGNMFLLRSPEVHASEQPSAWHFPGEGAGGYRKMLNNGVWHQFQVLKAYATLANARFRWDYLALREGECAIFSKRTTHMPNPLVGEAAWRPVRRCSASLPGASASAIICSAGCPKCWQALANCVPLQTAPTSRHRPRNPNGRRLERHAIVP